MGKRPETSCDCRDGETKTVKEGSIYIAALILIALYRTVLHLRRLCNILPDCLLLYGLFVVARIGIYVFKQGQCAKTIYLVRKDALSQVGPVFSLP